MKLMTKVFFALLILSFIEGCSYSFKGIAISPDLQTFFVEDFQNTALTAPGDLNQRFSDALRNKVRNESRLKLGDEAADIIYSGTIIRFDLIPEAAQDGNTVALNRLEIAISVNFANQNDENKNWKKTFSFFRTFPSDQDFISIQDSLIDEIFKQLLENIFNESFTGW